jgi:hypothetical protein
MLLKFYLHSCAYLAGRFSFGEPALSRNCVCVCDDDNDIEMALACMHAYIPLTSSKSMVETIRNNAEQFTLTADKRSDSTTATEAALSLILERIKS